MANTNLNWNINEEYYVLALLRIVNFMFFEKISTQKGIKIETSSQTGNFLFGDYNRRESMKQRRWTSNVNNLGTSVFISM